MIETTVEKVLDKLLDIIADDGNIKTFSNDKFGNDHFVFLFHDPGNPPGENSNPSFVIAGVKNVSASRSENIRHITIGIQVHGSDQPSNPGGGNKYVFDAGKYAEILRELGESAIRKNAANAKIVEGGTIPNKNFPLFTSKFTVEIKQLVSSKGK